MRVSSSSVHLLTEYSQPDVAASRVQLFLTLQKEASQYLLSLIDFELHDKLVGQPTDLVLPNSSSNFLGLVAQHLSKCTPSDVTQFRRKTHKNKNYITPPHSREIRPSYCLPVHNHYLQSLNLLQFSQVSTSRVGRKPLV